jgi:Tfp pilus assembly protein PilX
VVAVLVVGAVVSTWQAVRATRAEQAQTRLREEAESARNNEAQLRVHAEAEGKKAITEAARSAQVAQFMQDMLSGVGPAVATPNCYEKFWIRPPGA